MSAGQAPRFTEAEARREFNRALNERRLVRPPMCSRCGCSCTPDGHHPDLRNEPLQVEWLCHSCHATHHGRLRSEHHREPEARDAKLEREARIARFGSLIRRARHERGLSRGKLAEKAASLPGAPDISVDQIKEAERGRAYLKLEDDTECLPYILRALGMGGDVLLGAVSGMREGR